MARRFTLATLLGSALLFAVQPLVARALLPLTGGVPALWNTCVLFFQCALLAGYGYAHALPSRLGPRAQPALHLALLALALTTLPFSFTALPPPPDGDPTGWVLLALTLRVAPAFVLLSTGAPLLQRWYVNTTGSDPSPLIAASNVGSLAALLAYPLAVEPLLALRAQGRAFTAGFALYVLAVAACALRIGVKSGAASAVPRAEGESASADSTARAAVPRAEGESASADSTARAAVPRAEAHGTVRSSPQGGLLTGANDTVPEPSGGAPTASDEARWNSDEPAHAGLSVRCRGLQPAVPQRHATRSNSPAHRRRAWLRHVALAFVPSSLMLGVTTHLSTDVGSFPLMWVAPLAIYLATFIAVFARTPPAPGPRVVAPFLSLLVLMFLFTAPQVATRLPLVIGHLALFAWCAYLLHGELARTREDSGSVTAFQLALAVGGALGGAFNTLVAPHVFTRVTEYPLAMALAVLLLPPPPPPPDSREREEQLLRSVGLDPDAVLGPKRAPKPPPRFTIVDAMVPLAVGMLATLLFLTPMTARAPSLVRYGLPLIALVLLSIGQRIRLALGLVAILAAAKADPSVVYADRTFFGVLRVEDVHGVRRFMHGTTLHGLELLSHKDRGVPLAYYASTGPIGRAMTALTPALQGRSVGVVGLGVGMLIAYAQPSQHWTFYELDPAVEFVARRYFTWLRDARAPWSVVTGDARRTLARDTAARHGLLVLDAFSSDSIPVHLLTREALDLYRQRIDEHGVIAFHVTNRHVALDGVIAALARDAGMVAVRGRGRTLGPDGLVTTTWVLLARRGEDLGPLWGDPRWRRVDPRETRRAWTDDRSDLIGVMRWR